MWFQWKWWWWQKAKQALETSIFGTKFQLTPRKTNISPENQWLEDDMSFWNGSLFRVDIRSFSGVQNFTKKWSKDLTIFFLVVFFFWFIPTTSVRTTSNCWNFGTWTRKALKSCRNDFFLSQKNSSRENFWWSKQGVAPNDEDISELVLHCTYLWVLP